MSLFNKVDHLKSLKQSFRACFNDEAVKDINEPEQIAVQLLFRRTTAGDVPPTTIKTETIKRLFVKNGDKIVINWDSVDDSIDFQVALAVIYGTPQKKDGGKTLFTHRSLDLFEAWKQVVDIGKVPVSVQAHAPVGIS